MNKSHDCERVCDLIPEVALGLASGDDRAMVLRHAARCAGCREAIRQTAAAADELLLIAPAHEPPPGFEGMVLQRLEAEWNRGTRPRRVLLTVAAAVLVAFIGAAGALWITAEERDVGAYYQALLERTDGDYLAASLLHDESGAELGVVYAYQGKPSWMFVVMRDERGANLYDVVAVSEAGERVTLGSADFEERDWWGTELSVPVHEVKAFRLEGAASSLRATLGD